MNKIAFVLAVLLIFCNPLPPEKRPVRETTKYQEGSMDNHDVPILKTCFHGVVYITRLYNESSFTLARDRNDKPIPCGDKHGN